MPRAVLWITSTPHLEEASWYLDSMEVRATHIHVLPRLPTRLCHDSSLRMFATDHAVMMLALVALVCLRPGL